MGEAFPRLCGEAGNAVRGERLHFAGVGHAVAVPVLPHAKVFQFTASEPAVVIVIKQCHRLKAVIPKNPPSDAAKKLAPVGDAAGDGARGDEPRQEDEPQGVNNLSLLPRRNILS